MDYGAIRISLQGQSILPQAQSVVPQEKRISFALLMIDAALWTYALADIPRQLLAG